jgi:hypothetical protein
LAEAYGNLGISFLNIHKYDEALPKLRIAKELFSKRGTKEAADKAFEYELWAKNALELISKLNPLDEKFLSLLTSQNLTKLKEKTSEISREIKNVIKTFKERELPEEVYELLISKEICFTVLSNALNFEEVNLQELEKSKRIFERWGFNIFVIAVNSLENFILSLNNYKSLEEIPEELTESLLRGLNTASVLDGILTDKMSNEIKGKPYETKTTDLETKKEPIIKEIFIANTEKEWVKFCLVQLNFSVEAQPSPMEFGFALNESDKIKNKIFKALEAAKENEVDVICFPELSFAKEWVDEIKSQYKEMIIIGGSYYAEGYNVCPIIIEGQLYLYRK